ncbi:hypothetical protein RUM43_009950 [Polyplax serrata]|uniref:Uncharacterized protein n=1 Tax=Polyplax serrata TaxID=468196 RepID=A0AAN8PJX1_POLSC
MIGMRCVKEFCSAVEVKEREVNTRRYLHSYYIGTEGCEEGASEAFEASPSSKKNSWHNELEDRKDRS